MVLDRNLEHALHEAVGLFGALVEALTEGWWYDAGNVLEQLFAYLTTIFDALRPSIAIA